MLDPTQRPFPSTEFHDVIEGNRAFVFTFDTPNEAGRAAKGLAIVTCMDARIDPLAVVGMHPGDAKILRNPGARVTEDVLGALVLATSLLGVNRILVMPHTDCRMASGEEGAVHEAIFDASGIDSRSLEFRTVSDQRQALVSDVTRIRTFPFLPQGVVVAGAIYDVHEGTLTTVDA
ncbi:MAG: hypothetical protein CL523_00570 [Actinomycetales bacterium]|jgi:carbonic anhydrase|nr:MAG: hypothetical protein CL523_00570 [Actinomycetales bacterium]|tara:strand:+ start:498 stop:1025 length:528 start_codon:yes stop_codon:yes gene_type:complete